MKLLLNVLVVIGLSGAVFAHEGCNKDFLAADCSIQRDAEINKETQEHFRLDSKGNFSHVPGCCYGEAILEGDLVQELPCDFNAGPISEGPFEIIDTNKPKWFAQQKEVAMQLAKLVSVGVCTGAAGYAVGRIMFHLMAVPVPPQALTLIQTLLLFNVVYGVGACFGFALPYIESLLQSTQYHVPSRRDVENILKLHGSMLVEFNSSLTTSYLLQSFGY